MICHQFSSLLGFECHPLTEDGSVAAISSPFTFEDGDSLPLFVESVNGQVRFFDDGATLMHFIGRGVRIENKRNATFLISAAQRHGGTFNEAGEIEFWAPEAAAPLAFAKYLASLMDIVSWEKDQQGVNTDISVFVEEVGIALRAWKPGAEITKSPPFIGVSGKPYELDYLIDGQPVVATGPRAQSATWVLHKLVDIQSVIANAGMSPLIVIDDRLDPESADQESKVLQSVGTAIKFTDLEARAAASLHNH
ncbi:DUF1828 domain-containing protein [Acidovorax sp. LjRoot38]|uniref:DUF1828 domain-containing protein n=1 Tax=Acidovorax sp. LjRoot38 TaxID=3342327 RepID=UPI003ECF8325